MTLIRTAAQILADIDLHGGEVDAAVTPPPAAGRHPQAELVGVIRELAGQRLTDRQIAARLGVHRTTVQKLRRANGIPAGLGRVGRP